MRLAWAVLGIALTVTSAASGVSPGGEAPWLREEWRDRYRRPEVVPYPDNNPWSARKAQLGATLFFDPMLSVSHTMSCASCHQPGRGWSDSLPRSVGDNNQTMDLRAPTLLNIAWLPHLGWDGKFPDVESVSFRAIAGPANMGLPIAEALARLSANPAYVNRFEAAFGPGHITQQRVEQALATFERGIVSGPAPFDRWVEGDENAVSGAAKRGFALFDGKAGCSRCHQGWSFTDGSFQDIGTATGEDIGRGKLFPSSVALRYAFKVPTLRDVAARAPYMHNGSAATLDAVLDLYTQGGIARPSRSPMLRPLGLSASERADLTEFLKTLTSEPQPVSHPLAPR